MIDLSTIIQKFVQTRVVVVGDIVLDRFISGDVSRISPEAPIPVLAVKKEKEMLGGAGNVFANLTALGVSATVIALIGADDNGKTLSKIAKDKAGEASLVTHKTRPTTIKIRYTAQNQQLLRVDQEEATAIDDKTAEAIFKQAEKAFKKADVLILSDYNKGVLTPSLIKRLIEAANAKNIKVIVDPKGSDYSIYKGAYIVTPNKKELSEATGRHNLNTDSDIKNAAQSLIQSSGIENVIATRSADGMSVISEEGQEAHFPTEAQEVYDVSGAGDTVIAVIAASIAAGVSLNEAAQIANRAGGLVVAKLGTATVTNDELLNGENKVQGSAEFYEEWDGAQKIIQNWQDHKLKVGFTNGCFDIVHHGHVSYLAQAKKRCDRLVLGLNHDQSVKILKGASRPINDQMARASVMKALESIDMVVLFGATKEGEDNTPCDVIGALKPDVIFKGGDYTIDQLPEAQVALAYGGEVDIMPLYEGYSTTNIIKKSSQGSP